MNWFLRRGYRQGVFFTLAFLAIGPLLDAITKLLGSNLHPVEILFFRFAFSVLTIAPYFLFKKEGFFLKHPSKTDIKLNILRGFLGFLSFLGCIYSVKIFPLSKVTVIFWTMPFFILILSVLLLKERASASHIIATILGFSGLCFFFSPTLTAINFFIFVPIFTTLLFALQDIIIKKISRILSTIHFIFEYSVIITICAAPLLFFTWKTPSAQQFCLLAMLGIGANLMQFCIFKAFQCADLSSLAPFRYTEVIFAGVFGYAFFGECPTIETIYAAAIIVPTTFYLVISEKRRKPGV